MVFFISKYDKNPPNLQVDEYQLPCTVEEMRDIFNAEDDPDMIYVYPIKTQEQIEFFKARNIPIDTNAGHFFVECYGDMV